MTVRRRFDDRNGRLGRAATIVVGVSVVLALRHFAIHSTRVPEATWERVVSSMSWLWLAAMPAMLIGSFALVMPSMGRPRRTGKPITSLVSYRICSRGQNAAALADTIEAIRATHLVRPLYPYRIEVVTDLDVDLPEGDDLTHYVVPEGYRTPKGSRWKARALHYLSEVSDLRPKDWVMHLDEESHITTGLVGGIRDAVQEEEKRARSGLTPRIGQGAILYWRHLDRNPYITLADSVRTGDDVTRFFVQFRSGRLFCGMHGSFILVRSDIESTVSFDVGPEGSITEDAFWAYSQAGAGREFRWVDGHVVEQSPETWADFVKQRRRWCSGLWKVARYAPADRASRAALFVFLISWAAGALAGFYTGVNLFVGWQMSPGAAIGGAITYGWYLMIYSTGFWINLRAMPEARRLPRRRIAWLWVVQIVALPLFGIAEGLAVAMAVLRPERQFHVVAKSGTQGSGTADAGDLVGISGDRHPVPVPALLTSVAVGD